MAPAVWALALTTVALHGVCLTRYGYFRDELYYLACAGRLAWGYVDHPPLSVAVLWAVTSVFGDSLVAVRMPVVLAGAATVVLVGTITRDLGGRGAAQSLAALCAATAPVYLVVFHLFSMNGLDVLLWSWATLVFVRLLRDSTNPRWLGLGIIVGLGLLNKYSMLWLMAGIGVALVLTPYRRVLRTPGPWMAALLAGAIFSPHLVWQVENGWPSLEFIRNATELKMAHVGPMQFLLTQLVVMNVGSAPVWIAGLLGGLVLQSTREARPLAVAFLVVAGILIASMSARENYLSPAFPLVFGIGAVLAEEWIGRRRGRRWAVFGPVALFGAATAPLALPILPVDKLEAMIVASGLNPPQTERGEKSPIQGFADMHGWQEMTLAVERALERIPPEKRAGLVVYTHNYGQASAIEFFGRGRGLPPVISRHNSFWLWGPGDWDGRRAIVVGPMPPDHEALFESVVQVEEAEPSPAVPEERNIRIFLASELRVPVYEFWSRVRHFW